MCLPSPLPPVSEWLLGVISINIDKSDSYVVGYETRYSCTAFGKVAAIWKVRYLMSSRGKEAMNKKVLFVLYVLAGLLIAVGPVEVLAGGPALTYVPSNSVASPPPLVACGPPLPHVTPMNPRACGPSWGSRLLRAPGYAVNGLGNLAMGVVDLSICAFEGPLCLFDHLLDKVACTGPMPVCAPPMPVCAPRP